MTAVTPVDEMVWAPPFFQCLCGQDVWSKLTKLQRGLVEKCRVEVNPKAKYPNRFKVQLDGLGELPPRTLSSLQSKGVADERGQLTEVGVYTALWGPPIAEAKAARKAS